MILLISGRHPPECERRSKRKIPKSCRNQTSCAHAGSTWVRQLSRKAAPNCLRAGHCDSVVSHPEIRGRRTADGYLSATMIDWVQVFTVANLESCSWGKRSSSFHRTITGRRCDSGNHLKRRFDRIGCTGNWKRGFCISRHLNSSAIEIMNTLEPCSMGPINAVPELGASQMRANGRRSGHRLAD